MTNCGGVHLANRRTTRAQDGDFEAYVLEVRGRLVRFATMLCAGDAHRAEDAVQTALTRVYLAWPRIGAVTRDAYVRRAVVNAVIDEGRRVVRRAEVSMAQPPERVTADGPDIDDASDVLNALAALPPRMRAAVILRYVDGLNVAEAAYALRCSEGTVKSQSARALQKLRCALPHLADVAPVPA
jgi:RNA polymerase sigma-70 factor (sigma-E family)